MPEAREVHAVEVSEGVFLAAPAPVRAPRPPAPSRGWDVPRAALPPAAALAAGALVRHGLDPRGALAAGVLFVVVVLAAIDLRWGLLPNRIVIPAAGAVLAAQLAVSPAHAAECAVAAAGAAALLLLPGLLEPGAVGMGDVKLAALLGATFGAHVIPALTLGFLAAAPVAGALLVLRRAGAGPRRSIPMGPFLGFGAAVALLA
jgi:leader peptidase (prepilin peptidase)/N-methyltransferase